MKKITFLLTFFFIIGFFNFSYSQISSPQNISTVCGNPYGWEQYKISISGFNFSFSTGAYMGPAHTVSYNPQTTLLPSQDYSLGCTSSAFGQMVDFTNCALPAPGSGPFNVFEIGYDPVAYGDAIANTGRLIKKTFHVDVPNCIFKYQYGLISGGCYSFFSARVVDQSNNVVINKLTNFFSAPGGPSNIYCPRLYDPLPGGGSFQMPMNQKPFLIGSLDLSAYYNQDVTIEFVNSTCSSGQHLHYSVVGGFCYCSGCNNSCTSSLHITGSSFEQTLSCGTTVIPELCCNKGYNLNAMVSCTPNNSSEPQSINKIKLLDLSGNIPAWVNGTSLNSGSLFIPNNISGFYDLRFYWGATNGTSICDSCTYRININCTPTCNITLTNTTTNASCSNSNGSINLTVTGGAAPYTYVWSNGAGTEDINGLAPGTYTVTVTDHNNCTATTSANITNIPRPDATVIIHNASCDSATGSIDLTVTGGAAPYTYSWNNGAATEDISGLAPGTYSVTVTDHNNCTATTSATITNIPAASATATVTNASCGNSNGAIDLTVTGGIAPYTFAWSNAAITEDISGLTAGMYSVIVKDSSGCRVTFITTVANIPGPAATATATNTGCSNANGSVDLTVTGGTAPYNYSWSNSATTKNISGLAAGTYTVTVTDARSCTTTTSATVNITAGPTVTATVVNSNCGKVNGGINLTVTGGLAPYTYHWSNGATTKNISGLAPGSYTVTVTDQNNCTATTTATVVNIPGPSLSVVVTRAACGSSNGAIDLTVTGTSTGYLYSWSNGATTEDISGLAPGTYTVDVKDAGGCTASATVQVTGIACPTCSCGPRDGFTRNPVIAGDDIITITATCGQNIKQRLRCNTPLKFWIPFRITDSNLCQSAGVNAEIKDATGHVVVSASGVSSSSPLTYTFPQEGRYCISFYLEKNGIICKTCSFCFYVGPCRRAPG